MSKLKIIPFCGFVAIAFLHAPGPLPSNQAFAQKGAFLSAQTPWAVNTVGDARDLNSSYCAVAKKFDQNVILTMARNAENSTSIAIDFQTKRLELKPKKLKPKKTKFNALGT